MDGSAQLAPLTVDFHEPGFVAAVNGENAFRQQKGFWFELSDKERQQMGMPWGPANPQALNRYSYVLNNPVRYVDPTGHERRCDDIGDSNCGRVVNNSSEDVLIHGNRRKYGCQGNGEDCFEEATMILKAGQSSDDLGFVDVDFVRAIDDQHPIAGRGTDQTYKVGDGATAYIGNDARDGTTLTDVQTRANAIKADIYYTITGNRRPGWYSSNEFKITWKPKQHERLAD